MFLIALVSKLVIIIYTMSSLLPLSKSDAWWIRIFDFPRLQMLAEPMENEYGLVFFSRLPFERAQIKYLIEPHIPSLQAKVVLPSGDRVAVFGLHPRPPRQKSGPTTERDAELVQIAKTARKSLAPVVSLTLQSSPPDKSSGLDLDDGDLKEARETIDRAEK